MVFVKITHACENPRTSDCRHNVQVIIYTMTPVAYNSYDSLRLLIFFCWTAWEGETAWLARNCANQGVSISFDHSLWTVQDPSTQYWTSEDSVKSFAAKLVCLQYHFSCVLFLVFVIVLWIVQWMLSIFHLAPPISRNHSRYGMTILFYKIIHNSHIGGSKPRWQFCSFYGTVIIRH